MSSPTHYACLESNNNSKFRFAYHETFSSQQSGKVFLIDFENSVKYMNDNCPLDVINTKVFTQLVSGLVSVKISDETKGVIELTIGTKCLKLEKTEITSQDFLQEQVYLLEKKFERMLKGKLSAIRIILLITTI
ncbi:predicted protein [Naegleria gruberi]|uniref:Predicted protein n=1 Tax=Naegleria gruberi TaxID=5762 RepID=D2VW11_NAEGR|nr:uncharacterized protein NAEGRDRAFT_73210 [Naegleria gruberi]EFC38933.1 predicted protein [Naegleria gruberi]|eukprot:XP_002671677.1 predicted protein [Naegleria gruberi strain NEG-M]